MKTTQDTLFQGQLLIEQPEKGYRYGLDSVLLAATCPAKHEETVLDMGCGVGTVMLAIAKRLDKIQITGIELQPALAKLANRNHQYNDFQERSTIIHGHINDKAIFKKIETFDHIVCNPPYFEQNKTNHSKINQKNLSKIDLSGDLSEWVTAANRYLKPRGTATFIYPTVFSDKLITALQKKFKTLILFPLWPRTGQNSKLMIIQAIKDRNSGLILKPGLVLHESNGQYTKPVLDIINNMKPLPISE